MADEGGTPEDPSGDGGMSGEEESFVRAVANVAEDPIDAIKNRIEEIGDPEEGVEQGSSSGCLMYLAVTAAVLGVVAVVAVVWLLIAESDQAQPAGPQTAIGLQFENTYNSEGQLIPIPGEWEIYNEAGTASCAGDTELTAGNRRGELELLDPEGQRIRVRPPDSDWTEMELISSSATEAVYTAPITRDFEFTLTFTSSSTLGARLDGCADRGGQGWLEEPAS